MNRLTRALDAATAVEDVDRTKRTVVHKINTDAVDRYRTLIVPTGMRADNFRQNPVVLCNHNGMALPIGRNLDLKAYARKIVARTQFLPRGTDETADKVFDLYEAGFLNAWSISFDPIADGPPTPDEIRKRPELAGCERVYREWDLLEYSAVTVPGNPEATRAAIARGLDLPGWTLPPEPLRPELPPLVGRTRDEAIRDARAMARELARGGLGSIARDAQELARGMV